MPEESGGIKTIFRVQAEEVGSLRPVHSACTHTVLPSQTKASGGLRPLCSIPPTLTWVMKRVAEVPGIPPFSKFSPVACAQAHTLFPGRPLQMDGELGQVPVLALPGEMRWMSEHSNRRGSTERPRQLLAWPLLPLWPQDAALLCFNPICYGKDCWASPWSLLWWLTWRQSLRAATRTG